MRYKKRIEGLKRALNAQKLDGLLVTKSENILYLTGFDGEGSSLLITPKSGDVLITDPRFMRLAEDSLRDLEIKPVDGPRHDALGKIAKKRRVRRLGFESDWLTHNGYAALRKAIKGVDLIPRFGFVEKLREVKDNEEIRFIKRSAGILKEAYAHIKKKLSPGQTTESAAALIDSFMISRGASRTAFRTIVAQDPHSSYPHGPAAGSRIEKDSVLLLDIGAVHKEYNSDLTRVVFLGKITAKFKRIYNIIKTAQKRAIDKISPGVKISEVDKAARQYISNKGFGKYFLHSLGHGIGLEIHESPVISRRNHGILTPGMVFTVEPGIYIPGWGGVRLEDMVLVIKEGCEVLTDDIPK